MKGLVISLRSRKPVVGETYTQDHLDYASEKSFRLPRKPVRVCKGFYLVVVLEQQYEIVAAISRRYWIVYRVGDDRELFTARSIQQCIDKLRSDAAVDDLLNRMRPS